LPRSSTKCPITCAAQSGELFGGNGTRIDRRRSAFLRATTQALCDPKTCAQAAHISGHRVLRRSAFLRATTQALCDPQTCAQVAHISGREVLKGTCAFQRRLEVSCLRNNSDDRVACSSRRGSESRVVAEAFTHGWGNSVRGCVEESVQATVISLVTVVTVLIRLLPHFGRLSPQPQQATGYCINRRPYACPKGSRQSLRRCEKHG